MSGVVFANVTGIAWVSAGPDRDPLVSDHSTQGLASRPPAIPPPERACAPHRCLTTLTSPMSRTMVRLRSTGLDSFVDPVFLSSWSLAAAGLGPKSPLSPKFRLALVYSLGLLYEDLRV